MELGAPSVRLLHAIKIPDVHRTSSKFSLDGTRLVFAYDGKSTALRVLNVETGKFMENTRMWSASSVSAMAVCPPRRAVVAGCMDGKVRVWDWDTGGRARSLRGHTHDVTAICLTSDADRIVSGCTEGTIRVWDFTTGKCLKVMHTEGLSVRAVCTFATGSLCAAALDGNLVSVWDMETGMAVCIFDDHTERIECAVAFPTTMRLATSSEDRTTRIWDLEAGACVQELCVPVEHEYAVSVAVSPDESMLAAGYTDAFVRLWDLRTGNLVCVFEEHGAWVRAVAFSADGKTLRSATNCDDVVCIWDVEPTFRKALLVLMGALEKSIPGRFVGRDGDHAILWRVAQMVGF